MAWDFEARPLLVFWETTRACGLACKHCRASAIAEPLPGELTHEEGLAFIDHLASFGRPSPILILTGGDVLRRGRLWELIDRANERGVPFALSPSVTPLLTEEMMRRFKDVGTHSISLSLDSATAEGHDGLRGVPGTFDRTMELIAYANEIDLKIQINTTVMASNVRELPLIFEQIQRAGADVWEVFFLISEGRGSQMVPASPPDVEAVCEFLVASANYGVTVRTVEAPFFRRVALEQPEEPRGLAADLIADLRARLGPATHRPRNRSANTRDGKGIVFINYKGEVTPSGFLPTVAGNLREQSLRDIYCDSDIFRRLRQADAFQGRCGICPHRDLCGGSRARAYFASGDPLGEDPACVFQPD
ncbi:MAG: TIGR04053 family radical SAM/SPASM domain-containing protein [Armatimonadetes bacterium]|nr:TIGR04053 family radical SAM/SPASM domain-containing protein [Armatimonadota bacterium]